MLSKHGCLQIPASPRQLIETQATLEPQGHGQELTHMTDFPTALMLLALTWFISATLINIIAVCYCLLAIPIAFMAFGSGTSLRNHIVFLVEAGVPVLVGTIHVVSGIQMWKCYGNYKYGLAFAYSVPPLLVLIAFGLICFVLRFPKLTCGRGSKSVHPLDSSST